MINLMLMFCFLGTGFSFQADKQILSRSKGGEIHFRIYSTESQAGSNYQILAGVTGTYPGQTLPNGAHLPLRLDWVTRNFIYFDYIGIIVHNFHGVLNDYGINIAWLRTGPLSCCTINRLFLVCVCGGPRWSASNVVEIKIVD